MGSGMSQDVEHEWEDKEGNEWRWRSEAYKIMKNSTEWKWLNLIKWNVANAQTESEAFILAMASGGGEEICINFIFYFIIPIYWSMYFMTILFNGERMKHESAIGINFHQVMTVHRQNCPFNLENENGFFPINTK